MLKLLKSFHKHTITFRIQISNVYTTSKAVVEIFSLNGGKVKLLDLESVRRIIIRERQG
jgi:hypothetical protein